MKKGMAIDFGGGEEPDAEEASEGMDVEAEELRASVKAFFSAAQANDLDAGVKAWKRLKACSVGEDIGPEYEE